MTEKGPSVTLAWQTFSLQNKCLYVYFMRAKSLQLRPTLCNPTDCNSPGSSVHGVSRQEYLGGFPFASPLLRVLVVHNLVPGAIGLELWKDSSDESG